MEKEVISTQKQKKKIEFPHMFVLLIGIILLFAILTYIIPAGEYMRIKNAATGKMVIDPSSFKYVKGAPISLFGILLAIEEGLIAAAPISFLIFMASASLYLVEKTGALDASIVWMIKKTQNSPNSSRAIIIVTMVIFSFWASTGTFSYEEVIIFIPIFCTLAIALGYDPLVGLGISFIPVGLGFGSATVNPFTVGVAQGIAELPLFSGIGLRIAVLVVMTLATVIYVITYANKIKKDPSKSVVAGMNFGEFEIDEARMATEFTTKRKLTLAILFAGIIFMVYGLSKKGWYINEVAAVFLGIAILVGIANRWNFNRTADIFVEGLSKAVMTAMIVGFSRGILVVIEKGKILDTMIHAGASLLSHFNLYISSVLMLMFQQFLNLIVPSGSGQATVSMPIIAPLADLIGMKRQIAVLIFQFGDGLSNLIWPTSFIFIACAFAKIPVNKYYKWFFPLFCIALAIQITFIFIALNIGYGPF